MKIKTILLGAASALLFTGCAVSNFNQAAVNTAAEQITADILVKDPTTLPALEALATALPTAIGPNSSMTSESLGTIIASKGLPSASAVRISAGLDGALRNYNAFQGGGAGGAPTIQAAIAGQILQVWADGMGHAIALYRASQKTAAP